MTEPDPKTQWPAPPPAPDLASRIAAAAFALPQAQSPGNKWREAVMRGLSDWRYGLAYKSAALLACALLGLGLGLATAYPHDPDPIDIAFMAEL